MAELKPCPFCGGKAKIRKAGKDGYCVVCSECGARGERVVVKEWHDTKYIAQQQAKNAWNTRATEKGGAE